MNKLIFYIVIWFTKLSKSFGFLCLVLFTIGTYSVIAKITNSAGYTLNDATSNELIIIGTPVVVTSSATSDTNSITVYGNVSSENGSSVTERGFVYSLTTNPTTSNTKVVSGSGLGNFSQLISGLTLNTTYYVRAYAINSGGTSYGLELSLTIGVCGGDIIGSGFGKNPNSIAGTDDNWKVVALPQGYTHSETLPYNAYVPLTSDLYNLNVYNTGYAVSGKTYYWIAPKANAKELLGAGVYYNWIVQQTFTVPKSGFYDLNFSGAGDNAISFYINGVIDTTDPLLPTITGGTQIGAKHNAFTVLGTFSGVTYLNAGVNTASMVMEDFGGDTVALISGSTFTCNDTYVNIVPVISTVADAIIVEGTTPSPIAFTISDLETPLNNLTVTATSSNTALIPNANIVFTGATGSRTITTTPVSGESGTATITITLDDNAGGVVTKTFVVTMNPIVLNKNGKLVSDDISFHVNRYGEIGNSSLTLHGKENFYVPKHSGAAVLVSSTETTANLSSTIAATGGKAINARGICWSTTANTTLANNTTVDGSGKGSFNSAITGLTKGTTYYVRAYATNDIGTSYGTEMSFTTPILLAVGDAYQGGTIFSVSAPGSDGIQHGLIRTGVHASNVSYNTVIGTTIPTANTAVLNGYSDWRLPKFTEAQKICQTGAGFGMMMSSTPNGANIDIVWDNSCAISNITKTYAAANFKVVLVRAF